MQHVLVDMKTTWDNNVSSILYVKGVKVILVQGPHTPYFSGPAGPV